MRISFGWKNNAGLVCLWDSREPGTGLAVHFLVQRSHWEYGYCDDQFGYSFGVGPILLITRIMA